MRRNRHNLKADQRDCLNQYLAQHPALVLAYRLKQHLCYLLLKKHRTRKQCARLIPHLLRAIDQLRGVGPAQLVTLAETLSNWQEEIATMRRTASLRVSIPRWRSCSAKHTVCKDLGGSVFRWDAAHGFEYKRMYPRVVPAGVFTLSTPAQPFGLLAAPSSARR